MADTPPRPWQIAHVDATDSDALDQGQKLLNDGYELYDLSKKDTLSYRRRLPEGEELKAAKKGDKLSPDQVKQAAQTQKAAKK